eukprot:6064215-Pleurochrysis_carterae.AAC.2
MAFEDRAFRVVTIQFSFCNVYFRRSTGSAVTKEPYVQRWRRRRYASIQRSYRENDLRCNKCSARLFLCYQSVKPSRHGTAPILHTTQDCFVPDRAVLNVLAAPKTVERLRSFRLATAVRANFVITTAIGQSRFHQVGESNLFRRRVAQKSARPPFPGTPRETLLTAKGMRRSIPINIPQSRRCHTHYNNHVAIRSAIPHHVLEQRMRA